MMHRFAPRIAMALPLTLALGACSGNDSEGAQRAGANAAAGAGGGGAEGGTVVPPNADGCNGYDLEADFAPTPLDGPGLVDGQIPAGEYIITTTYLRMQSGDAARQTFNTLAGDVLTDLQGRSGLVGFSLGLAAECQTARTLSVWASEEVMIEFVLGEAHRAAIRQVSEVSRGGSVTAHFTGTEADATWEKAAEQFVGFSGRVY
jgi:heme-degrading monooxygenase HmoA